MPVAAASVPTRGDGGTALSRPGLAVAAVLLLAPVAWFNQTLWPWLSGRTLLPLDILYTFEPWRSLRPGLTPHNALLGDLVFQIAVWRLQISRSLAAGEVPLWNPDVLTGIPLLGSGQSGALYPLASLFIWLPVPDAFAWYTAGHVALAGSGTYLLGRSLGLRRGPALCAAIAFAFSGFFVVGAVFPHLIGAATWLPWLLWIAERLIASAFGALGAKSEPEPGRLSVRAVVQRGGGAWVAGAAIVGVQYLAGHPETSYHSLLTLALYTLIRGVTIARCSGVAHRLKRLAMAWAAIASLVVLGTGLGAVQILPLADTLGGSVRQGSRSYAEVIGFAWPLQHLWTLLLPDLFGNPSHHSWLDIWARAWRPATQDAAGKPIDTIFWGAKNYVEGAQYVGVATWLLAVIAVVGAIRRSGPRPGRGVVLTFAAIVLISLLFVLGTPLYALLEYGLPGFQQLRSPFRWVFPFTLSVAMLGGLGLEAVLEVSRTRARRRAAIVCGVVAMVAGAGALGAVAASLVGPGPFVGLGERVVHATTLARVLFGQAAEQAGGAFASGAMFWSYEAEGLTRFGLVALAAGALVLAAAKAGAWRAGLVAPALVALTLADLFSVHGDFHASADASLWPLTQQGEPPVARFLDEREAGGQPWRFTTFNFWNENTLKANSGMYYGWQDIRGYDSIVPRQYVDLTSRLKLGSNELPYNRVGPFYGGGEDFSGLDSPLLDLLNVKYVLSEHVLPNAKLREVYRDDSIRVYENTRVLPRTFVASAAVQMPPEQQPLESSDPRATVFVEQAPPPVPDAAAGPPTGSTASVERYLPNEVRVRTSLNRPGWLVLTDAWAPGWHARGVGPDGQSSDLDIYRADGNFRTVYLPAGGDWQVTFSYAPASFVAGAWLSGLSLFALVTVGLSVLLARRSESPAHVQGAESAFATG